MSSSPSLPKPSVTPNVPPSNRGDDEIDESHAVSSVEAATTTSSKAEAKTAVDDSNGGDTVDSSQRKKQRIDVGEPRDDTTTTTTTTTTTNTTSSSSPQKPPTAAAVDPTTAKSDTKTTTSRDYYFDSYAHHGIHEEMLKDQVRTQTYQNAILQNPHLFRDKIVLDVGCGTGILSMFAAQAGARHVYAIDCSNIVDRAREIVERNGFGEVVTLIKGKVEEVELPGLLEKSRNNADDDTRPDTDLRRVDIIISEWMGYFLLYESMLDTVLFARDKWLTPTSGVIFPDKAIMYLCAAEDGAVKADRIDFWTDVYGFDMTPIRDVALREPVVDVVEPKQIVTDAVPIYDVDLLTRPRGEVGTESELSRFERRFRLTASRDDYVHGFVAYFECAFTQVHKPIGFSTSPGAQYTHWKQTVFYLEDALPICKGEVVEGVIKCGPNPMNKRDLDIEIGFELDGRHSKTKSSMQYHLR